MRNRILWPCLLCLLTLAQISLAESSAQAGIGAGLDAGIAIPSGDTADYAGLGYSLGAQASYVLPIPIIDLGAGLTGRYTVLPADPDNIGNADLDIWQVMGEARVAIDLVVLAPQAFIGLGYGDVSGEGSDYTINHSGFTYRVGAGVNVSAIPLLSVSVHVAFNEVQYSSGSGGSYNWIDTGLGVALSF